MTGRVTPEEIVDLPAGCVFVFGSNLAGRHGKGAARTALRWGAVPGRASGPQGRTYGIPTKCRRVRRTLSLDEIGRHVAAFEGHARANPGTTFLVTEVGCGLAGLHPKDVAPLFSGCAALPNVHLPARFWRRIEAT